MWTSSRLSGAITIYCAVIFSVLAGIFVTLFHEVRGSTIRFQIECGMDMGLFSVFAEYNRELLDRYDLFFIDSSYGWKSATYHNTEGHLLEYLQYNLEPERDITIGTVTDLYDMKVLETHFTEMALATDHMGALVRYEAIQYMRTKYGLELVEDLQGYMQEIEDYELLSVDTSSKRAETDATIAKAKEEGVQISEDEWVELDFDNPADEINADRSRGILNFTLEDVNDLSQAAVDLSTYSSHRELSKGTGITLPKGGTPDWEEEAGFTGQLLFQEYCMERMGNYLSPMQDGQLKYQIEYLISGNNCDIENLKDVANSLIWLREAANVVYLMQDQVKMAEVEALAWTLTALAPYLQPAVKASLVLAWAYAESVIDVRHLLAGGKVPLMKSSSDWNLSFSSILDYKSFLSNDEKEGKGLDYATYLRILMALTDEDELTMRAIDIMEMDLRLTPGNEYFRMDGCIFGVTALAYVASGYGYEYHIKRTYYY